jgi:hypothetical protein
VKSHRTKHKELIIRFFKCWYIPKTLFLFDKIDKK